MTFNEIKTIISKNDWVTSEDYAVLNSIEKQVARTLDKADRNYLSDNLDPHSGGNYQYDFTQKHGDREASPIGFGKGCPNGAGRGVYFI